MKLACELPDRAGRSLSTWTCAELARTLKERGIVEDISPQSVQRILSSYKLKPWRVHYWLTPKGPYDAAFRERVQEICDLYTRPLDSSECVLCVDEKTSIQPRPRTAQTRPARINKRAVQLEHAYARSGALNLIAAFDTRTGKVAGICRPRKRQAEFIELLELLDRRIPRSKTRIHIVCDNVRTHHGKLVQAWLAKHPRFHMHFPPVHCSWMNQIEQWFSILQRKRLKLSNFTNLTVLHDKILAFVDEWNEVAAPFEWTAKSFQKVLAKVDAAIKRAA